MLKQNMLEFEDMLLESFNIAFDLSSRLFKYQWTRYESFDGPGIEKLFRNVHFDGLLDRRQSGDAAR